MIDESIIHIEMPDDSLNNGCIYDTPKNAEIYCIALKIENIKDNQLPNRYGCVVVLEDGIVPCDIEKINCSDIVCRKRNNSDHNFNIRKDKIINLYKIVKRSF